MFKTILLASIMGCMSQTTTADSPAPPSPDTLWYDRPARDWNAALPIGNGRLGAMVFGRVDEELLQLNEDTLWSGGPRDWNNPNAKAVFAKVREAALAGRYKEADELSKGMQGPWTTAYQPMGDLRLRFVHAGGDTVDYRRDLDLDSALATTTYTLDGVTYRREVLASHPDQVIALHLTASAPGRISFEASLSSQLKFTTGKADLRTLALSGYAPVRSDPSYVKSENPIEFVQGRGMRFVMLLRAVANGGSVEVSDASLKVSGADSVTLLIAAATSFNGHERQPDAQGRDPLPVATASLDAASPHSFAALRAAHLADYQPLYQRVRLELGGPSTRPTDQRLASYPSDRDPNLVALVFQYGRYLLIASSRAGDQPANLQGIWSKDLRPAWSANYTMNINSQMNYWPAETTNLAECHEPMVRFVRELAENGRKTAQINYGLPGWVAHHNSDLWRQSAPVGDYGQGWSGWALFNLSNAWHCMDLWEHYVFNQDEAFLRETAYPVMKGAAEFCDGLLVENPHQPDELITAPSTSTENSFYAPNGDRCGFSIGSTQDMALIRDLFTRTIDAARHLGLDEAFARHLSERRAKLRPYRVGASGELMEFIEAYKETDPHHRHLSHLIGAYPGDEITPQQTPELSRAVARSLELRGDDSTGWSMAWKMNLWARLGDGDHALRMFDYLLRIVGTDETAFKGGGIYPNLFDAHPPFQIDGNFGATAAVAEMLLQSHRRDERGRYILHVLPALPGEWKSGSVTGLRARGGYELEFAWAQGKLTTLLIRNALGKKAAPVVVEANGKHVDVQLDAGASRTIEP
jgi:alpha-L-fucosidase 2